MPIRPYLAGRVSAPETILVMGAALDEACKVLQIGDLQSRKMVANTIIELVEGGKTDSGQFAAAAIDAMRGTKGAA
jgi:hypothetical protein